MPPDPGRETLERIHASLGAEARIRLAQELRARGLLSVWEQVDHASPMSPVEEGLFILERLYPEMPAEHRASLRRQMEAAHQAETWNGFKRPPRPETPVERPAGRVSRSATDAPRRGRTGPRRPAG